MFKPAAPYTALKLLQAGLDMRLGGRCSLRLRLSIDDIVDIHAFNEKADTFKFPFAAANEAYILSLLFSTSKWISLEQVPCVLYTI